MKDKSTEIKPVIRGRKWLVRVFVSILALCGIALGILYFSFSWIVQFAFDSYLDRNGYEGGAMIRAGFTSAEVEGLSLRGVPGVSVVEVGRVELDYGLLSVVRSKGKSGIKRLSVIGSEVELDLSSLQKKSVPADEVANEPKRPMPLSEVCQWIQFPIELKDANILVRKGDKDVVRAAGIDLDWSETAPLQGDLQVDDLSIGMVDLSKATASFSLVPEENTVLATELSFGESVMLSNAVVHLPPDGAGPDFSADVAAWGGAVRFEKSADEWSAELLSGSLSLDQIASFIEDERLPSGEVDELVARFAGSPGAFAEGQAHLQLGIRNVGHNGYAIDAGKLAAQLEGGELSVERLHVTASDAEIRGRVKVRSVDALVGSAKDVTELDVEGVVQADIASLGTFVGAFHKDIGARMEGTATADLDVAITGGELRKIEGPVQVDGFAFDDITIEKIALHGDSSSVANEIAAKGVVRVNAENTLHVDANYAIESTEWSGSVKLAGASLSSLARALQGVEKAATISGQATFDATLQGNARKGTYVIDGTVDLAPLQLEGGDPVSGKATVSVKPRDYELREIVAQIGNFGLHAARVRHVADRLSAESVEISEGGEVLATGVVDVPLAFDALSDAETFLQQDGELRLGLQVNPVGVVRISALAGRDLPGVAGHIEGVVAAAGTYAKPDVRVDAKLRGLAKEGVDAEPIEADVSIRSEAGVATLKGVVTQPEVQPIRLSAHVPLEPLEWAKDPDSARALPLKATAILPPTPLERIPVWVPMVASCGGTAEGTITVSGTTAAPVFGGNVKVQVDRLLCNEDSIPGVRDFVCDLRLVNQRVEIEQCGGMVAGGTFRLSGAVGVSNWTEPVFDLNLDASEALLYRTEDTNVRANIALQMDGPLAQAKVAGDLALVNSRFVKEIDLLPVAFPKRAPALPKIEGPRGVREPPSIGVSEPPLRDWEVDIKLSTDEPFLVVGNLATAEIHSDLRVTGTLAEPLAEGEVRVENGVATLPFSELKVDLCTLNFLPESGLDPKITVDGQSEVNGYQLRVHVYDTLLNPRSVLTSNPPLAEEDIISLLATGSTREELENAGEGEAMAKGGKILLEKMRQNMGLAKAEGAIIPKNLTFDVGGVNKRTGEPTMTAKLKLRKSLFILGDVDREGEYRSVLKWALRFR